ncbi:MULTISPECIES: hypothetical protein [unclassified Bradyrhizobium]|uniref:rhamnosyltransferase WsaF family glycosyltransferase n=1 Tax=unclassified Bradyrhizobium TaxID=2631580 RepID=UPI001FF7C7FD|nr:MULTISPECIES: hypothetical protein [unclassified Bradyrhizobium]MCK1521857.1 hypothetical protein [Bradyrhizobium sp. 17]MCK1688037.1 hypothetical protein [Bradyrhizobium sp. 145]
MLDPGERLKKMSSVREMAKRWLPASVKDILRQQLFPPPEEDVVLHGYEVVFEPGKESRLTLVIPTIAAGRAFGGVMTAVDFFLEIGKWTGADLRIILDNPEPSKDMSLVEKRALALGLRPKDIEILQRTAQTPVIGVRSSDVFLTFNWWITLNLLPVLESQRENFQQPPVPFLYLIQEYEPLFYPFSATHMLARLAFEPSWPCWGIFNSTELHDYFTSQGHQLDRSFVFEPKLSNALRPFLSGPETPRAKRILVYGRPGIPRNCFSAIQKGLTLWAKRYTEHRDWEVLSVGLPHRPFPLGDGREMISAGKLPLEAYAGLLRETAVGLSLMSSPHPSYPPLEMAHFGVLTITNRYANKDLSAAHDNITSLGDIRPEAIADAIAAACKKFDTAPDAGALGRTHLKSFLFPGPFDCTEELGQALFNGPWKR